MMRDGRIRGRVWGWAACAAALLLLVAAAVVGTVVYSAPMDGGRVAIAAAPALRFSPSP